MVRRDDAETLSDQASDTGLGEVASTSLVAAADTTSTVAVPSSTGRGLAVVETSTPPEPYSFSMPSATDMPLASSILPVLASSAGPTSADIPSSLATAANPIPTIAPVSISRWYTILPVSDPSPTTSADMTSLFYSIVSAAGPSISPWYSILPVSAIPTSNPTSADESTSLFYPIVTAPASSATTFVYSILPVSDTSTSSSTIAYTSIPPSTTPIADPTPTPDASILRMSDTITIPTSSPSILRVSESATPESPLVYSILPISEPSTLVYSILPISESSTLVYSIQPVSDAPGRTGVPTSTPTSPGISPTTGPSTSTSTSTSNSRIAITTDTPPPDAYHSTPSLSTDEAPATSSQRINNLALHPTSASASTVLVTSGSITQTYVVRPTGGITGVGGSDSSSGPGEEGPSSGDTPSQHALPIARILGPVLAGVVLLALVVGFVVVVRWRRRRSRRWYRLPYEPALDTSRHSSRFLNPFEDIDDDWSIIASEVERPVSTTTTTASTLAFAPAREDEYSTRYGVLR